MRSNLLFFFLFFIDILAKDLSCQGMSTILRPFTWFYHEFGIVSIRETGRNAWLLILARTCRMFAYGTNSLILGKSAPGLVLRAITPSTLNGLLCSSQN